MNNEIKITIDASQATAAAKEAASSLERIAEIAAVTNRVIEDLERSLGHEERIVRDAAACNGAGAWIVETIMVIDRRPATQAEIEALADKPKGTVKSAS